MAKIGRPRLPPEQRQWVWDLWKSGSSISVISREVDEPTGSVFTILEQNGGFYSPAQKRRVSHLTKHEREEISRGLASGEGVQEIAMIQTNVLGESLAQWSSLINPQGPVGATEIHGITDSAVADKLTFDSIAEDVIILQISLLQLS